MRLLPAACALALFFSWGAAQEDSPQNTCIRGRIVDDAGAPLDGVRINVSGPMRQSYQVKSGKDGKFVLVLDNSFVGLSLDSVKGEPMRVEAMRKVLPGYVMLDFGPYFTDKERGSASPYHLGYGRGYESTGSMGVIVSPGDTRDLGDVVFHKHGITVEGRILTGDDKPVAGATVVLSVDMGVHLAMATTDAEGCFSIEAGKWRESDRITILKVFQPGSVVPCTFEFADWKVWTKENVILRTPDATATLSGNVEAHDGPVANAELYLYGAKDRSLSTPYPVVRTKADGSFLFSGISPGRYTVWVVSGRDGRICVEVDAPAENVCLRFPEKELGRVQCEMCISYEGLPDILLPAKDTETRAGLFLCDAQGRPMRPLAPVALVEVSKDAKRISFAAENLEAGKVTFRIRPCVKDDKPADILDKSGYLAGTVFRSMEEWRLLPQDPFLDRLGAKLDTDVEAGKTKELRFDIVITQDDLREILEASFTGRND